jgi:NAD(P)-dependent dehydrogenase (short-subunit alcohol dehydrogenase family)
VFTARTDADIDSLSTQLKDLVVRWIDEQELPASYIELGARKIRVNSINPGMIETEGVHAAGFIGSDFEKGAVAQTPLGRIGQVDDIATVAAFLASRRR